MSELLRMEHISKRFGNFYANQDINFSVAKGEVHTLLGENGAGKSTLIKVLGGIHQPDSGSIFINDEKVNIRGINEARKYGIGIIHQEIVLVPFLTVAQNIFLGHEPVRAGVVDSKTINADAQEMVARLGLDIDVTTPLERLTIAQQQMVEIVKVIQCKNTRYGRADFLVIRRGG